MPAETEDMIKGIPVPLDADAYKRVWPDQIWPPDIPGAATLAVDVRPDGQERGQLSGPSVVRFMMRPPH